jgi:hypothetical protein
VILARRLARLGPVGFNPLALVDASEPQRALALISIRVVPPLF